MNQVVYPFNFANRRGIPLIESSTVTSDTTNAIVTIANGTFKNLEERGVFLFRLTTAIPTAAAALPIIFSWTGWSGTARTQALTLVNGAEATATQVTGPGVYLVYYDKTSNLLQLMTTGA